MSILAAVAGSLSDGRTLSLAAIPNPSLAIQSDPLQAIYDIQLESDGDIATNVNEAGYTDIGDWINPKAAAPGAYEVRMTVNSGSIVGGTTGSWLALSTAREWRQAQVGPGTALANVTLEIRLGGAIKASRTFDFNAVTL
jgi:hypothetical protein